MAHHSPRYLIAISILFIAVAHARPNSNQISDVNKAEPPSVSRYAAARRVVSGDSDHHKCNHETHCKHGSDKFPDDELSKYERSILEEHKSQDIEDIQKRRFPRDALQNANAAETAEAKEAEAEMGLRMQDDNKDDNSVSLVLKISGVLKHHFANGTVLSHTIPEHMIVKQMEQYPAISSRLLTEEASAEAGEENDKEEQGKDAEISPRLLAAAENENNDKDNPAAEENAEVESDIAARSLDVLAENDSKSQESPKQRRQLDAQSNLDPASSTNQTKKEDSIDKRLSREAANASASSKVHSETRRKRDFEQLVAKGAPALHDNPAAELPQDRIDLPVVPENVALAEAETRKKRHTSTKDDPKASKNNKCHE